MGLELVGGSPEEAKSGRLEQLQVLMHHPDPEVSDEATAKLVMARMMQQAMEYVDLIEALLGVARMKEKSDGSRLRMLTKALEEAVEESATAGTDLAWAYMEKTATKAGH